MPILIPRTHISMLGTQALKFIVRDDFNDTKAAGSVNATVATPGPGTRVVVDTDSKLTISDGLASLPVHSTPAYGDLGLWYGAQTRASGLTQITVVSVAAGRFMFGWDTDQSSTTAANGFFLSGNALSTYDEQVGRVVGAMADSIQYTLATILRTSGAFHLIKGGAFSDWTLLWTTTVQASATVYPGVMAGSQAGGDMDISFIRVMQLASPWSGTYGIALGFATFTDDNDTAIADYVPEVGSAWAATIGTWSIQTNAAQASAVVGGVGIATFDAGYTDVLQTAGVTRAGGVAGVVLRYADADNYVYATHDGTNANLIKRVAGSETSMISTATTYSAGAEIRVIADGTTFDLFYKDSRRGTAQTIADAGLQTGTRAGLYTTDVGNTFAAADTYPRDIIGSAKAELERWTR